MHGERTAADRQGRKSLVQLLDQAGAVGQARQRVVMGEKADAAVAVLLFLGATVERDGRDPEAQRRQQAERYGSKQEGAVDPVALLGLVHIGRDDGDRDLVDQHRDIGAA